MPEYNVSLEAALTVKAANRDEAAAKARKMIARYPSKLVVIYLNRK
jgi:hypothetical protein